MEVERKTELAHLELIQETGKCSTSLAVIVPWIANITILESLNSSPNCAKMVDFLLVYMSDAGKYVQSHCILRLMLLPISLSFVQALHFLFLHLG